MMMEGEMAMHLKALAEACHSLPISMRMWMLVDVLCVTLVVDAELQSVAIVQLEWAEAGHSDNIFMASG